MLDHFEKFAISVFIDTNGELIKKALENEYSKFSHLSIELISEYGNSGPVTCSKDAGDNKRLFWYIPSLRFRFEKCLTEYKSENDRQIIADITESYIQFVREKSEHGNLNFMILPKQIKSSEFGLGVGDFKNTQGLRRTWLFFVNALVLAFEKDPNFFILNYEDVFEPHAKDPKNEYRLWCELLAEQSWGESKIFAKRTISYIRQATLIPKVKCVCLDLDNTIWGGAIGDLGIKGIELGGLSARGRAFLDIQKYFKKLKNRGFFLSAVSKNYLENVIEVFENHPDMVLKKEDFTVIHCGWGEKSSRIEKVAKALNIAPSSIVFFDDSAYEREEVKTNAPDILVPDFTDNPFENMEILNSTPYFSCDLITAEDFNRANSVHVNSVHLEGDGFLSLNDFKARGNSELSNKLNIEFQEIQQHNLTRCTQLLNKTNQFNLKAVRYTEKELEKHIKTSDFCIAAKVTDAYGEYGITVVLIAQISRGYQVNVTDFVMSCRVFGRGVEKACVDHLLYLAEEKSNIRPRLVFRGLDTSKNKPIQEFIANIALSGDYVDRIHYSFG